MTEELIQAKGRYELLKEELKKLSITAGVDHGEIYKEVNILLAGKSVVDIDCPKVRTLLDELETKQTQIKGIISEMKKLAETYNLH